MESLRELSENLVTPSIETEPQVSTSASNKFRDPGETVSSASDGIDINIPSKHLLEMSPIPKIPMASSKRQTKCNHSNITGIYQETKGR
jgi:hypothetical protein